MTQSPDPNNRPETPTRRRLWLTLLSRAGIPIAVLSALGIGGGLWYGSKFVQQDLAPLLERNLSELLDRPVDLGQVEGFSLSGLRFGKSSIPATPNDRDRASVEGVEIGFNLLQLLLTRKLNLDITLIQPDVYLDQEKDGVWVKTQIKAQEQQGLIQTELQQIRFKDGNLELDAFPKPEQKRIPVTFRQVTGATNFFDNGRRIAYDLNGESTKQGGVDIKGETIVNNGLNSNLNIRGRELSAVEIDRLVKFPINLTQGRTNGNVNVQLRPDQRAIVKGTANFKDVTVQIPQLPQSFAKSAGNLQIDDTLITLDKASSQLGKIPFTADGTIDTEKGFNVAANVRAVSVKDFFDTFNVDLPFETTGEATANIKVTGAAESPIVSGSVRNTKTARVDRINLTQASSDFRLNTKTLNLALSNIRATPEVGGQVAASGNLDLNAPQSIAINYQAQNLPGDAIARLYNNGTLPITVGRVNARGQIVGQLDQVQTIAQFQAPEATYPGTGEVVVSGGNTVLRNAVFQVAGGTVAAQGRTLNGRWQGTVQASNVQASRFSPQVQGLINGNAELAGSLSSVQPENIQARGQARLTNGNSFVNANFNAIAGRWQADTQIAGIALNQFSPQLRGDLSGNVRLAGALNALRPEAIRADGQVRLSQGISLIDQPLVAQINWDGQRLNIPQATAQGFRANGVILADLSGTPQITGLDLAVQATGYALANLPIPRPPVTQLSGAVDLIGRVTGTPDRPRVVSNVTVRKLSLNGITFDPVLNGTLNLLPAQGFDLRVAGVQDRIALNLDPNFRPRSLNVQRDQATLIGQTRGNIFQVAVQQFPIEGFVLPGVDVSQYGGIGGTLAGNLNIDLDRLRVIDGNATVQNLRVGSFRADVATTGFVNRNNVFEFSDTVLSKGQSKYTLTGNVDLRSQPKFNGKIAIAQGRIEDILGGLQFFDIQDFARGAQPPAYNSAADLNPIAVGNPQAPLIDQLRRFAEINALLRQTNQAIANNRIPQTADIRGNFGGDITVSASVDQGVQANFDLRAQNVEYRPYQSQIRLVNGELQPVNNRVLTAEQVIALGSLNNGVVSLEPLRIQSGDSRIDLTGQFGGETQFGQLTAQNLPIAEIDRFYPLPLGIDGKLNTTVTISGTRTNPSAVGQVQVADGFLNGKEVESATGNFTYNNSRLSFGSNIALSTNEPIRIDGSFPYQLLPDSVRPDSSEISLNLDVKNEGLSVINAFVPQLAWRGGQGAVKLNVAGTLLRPEVTGSIALSDATIESTALQSPLTGITGSILFNRDRLSIESLQGQFNRGQVIAKGTLPILVAADADPNNPLQITLDRLAINRKGLYQGGVTGNITILGTAFAPEIGGQVQLADGQIQLPDTEATESTTSPSTPGSNRQNSQPSATLNNLKLVLGDRVQIVRAPLINFLASGTLTVNGGLDALRPEGTIRLRSGQVNLFTTQFVLERGYPQTAIFERDRGLDPVLDVRLIASVPEVTGSRIAATGTAEFADNSISAPSIANLGSLRTVRIQAKATGVASQLFQNLELTSSPSRSRTEIVSLIGGGFVNTLGRGDSTLGIANLAGSALLTNIQGFIGNAVGLSDFRLFPTLLDRGQQRGSTLGLAAEVGVDITRNLSASVLRVLTADQPTQFGVRYRFSDSLLFRGSTNLSGDSQGVLEYEFRF